MTGETVTGETVTGEAVTGAHRYPIVVGGWW
jgi:hypothetical protein